MPITELIKTEKWWIGPHKGWVFDEIRYWIYTGIGDFIFNNCVMIIWTGDRSPWACKLFELCADLASRRQRWPNEIQKEIEAAIRQAIKYARERNADPKNTSCYDDYQCQTRLCSAYHKYRARKKRKRKEQGKPIPAGWYKKSRSRNDMTRDPYIALFACAVFLDRYQFLSAVSIPYYNYDPGVWRWHKIIKYNAVHKEQKYWISRYGRDEDFVENLNGLMQYTYDMIKWRQKGGSIKPDIKDYFNPNV